MTDRWHIALTESNSERLATAHLNSRRYQAIYPVFPKLKAFKGKLLPVYRPMFTGYLFVRKGANLDWRRLETAPGIRVTGSLLKVPSEGIYATISQEEFDQVQATANRLCEQFVEAQMPPQYHVGDKVVLISGPFAGFLATIETLDDKERNVGLETYLFGRKTKITGAKPEHLTAA